MRLRLFAPLRAKITSSVRSTEPCWSPQLRTCRSLKNSTPRRLLCEAVRPWPMTGQADQASEKVEAHKNSELAAIARTRQKQCSKPRTLQACWAVSLGSDVCIFDDLSP